MAIEGTTPQGESAITDDGDSLEKQSSSIDEGSMIENGSIVEETVMSSDNDESHTGQVNYRTMNWWHLTLRMCFSFPVLFMSKCVY
jgi:hypothetical protein